MEEDTLITSNAAGAETGIVRPGAGMRSGRASGIGPLAWYQARLALRTAFPLGVCAALGALGFYTSTFGLLGLFYTVQTLEWSTSSATLFLAALAFLFFSGLNRLWPRVRWDLRSAGQGHRFVCPHCLCFSLPRWSCICGSQVANDPRADAPLASERPQQPNCWRCWQSLRGRLPDGTSALRAWCQHCERSSPRHPHQQRAVRVCALLRAVDLKQVEHLLSAARSPDSACLCLDNGAELQCYLCVPELEPDRCPLPRHHALHDAEMVWTAGDTGVLEVGQAADCLLRLWPEAAIRAYLLVGAPEENCPGAELLRRRFRHVLFGVPLSALVAPAAAPTDPILAGSAG